MTARRQSHEAGQSWRKWSDPLQYGRVGPDWSRRGRILLFWMVCWDFGALCALLLKVTR